MGILGSSNKAEIGPFFRKELQHGKRNLTDQLQSTLYFLNQVWNDFLVSFCDEFILDTYIDNRRHEIGGVYQQKWKDEPDQDLSYAFIPVENDFSSMPDTIHILLAYDRDGIGAHICPFQNILVREGEHNIVGRYIADDSVGEDCLLTYRKYTKDKITAGAVCMFYEQQNGTTFYHHNPFFTVTTVSNDDNLIARSSLPF